MPEWLVGQLDACSFQITFLDSKAPILKYMGDYPSKKIRPSTDLTDQIFEPALVHVSHCKARLVHSHL